MKAVQLEVLCWSRRGASTAALANSVGDCEGPRSWWGGYYFRLAATFGKGEVTSRSSAAMASSGAASAATRTARLAKIYHHDTRDVPRMINFILIVLP